MTETRKQRSRYRYGTRGFTEEVHHRFVKPSTLKEQKFASKIFSLLEAADKEASLEEKDTIQRLFAAFLSERNVELIEDGDRRQLKRWDGNAPTAVRDRTGGYEIEKRGFVDHSYRVVDKESGFVSYATEPYQIRDIGVRDLADLQDEGWSTTIRADGLHFPSRTLQVVLQRKEY